MNNVFTSMIGLTMLSVSSNNNNDDDDDELIFTSTDGRYFRFYHKQDCCERVFIEDVCGDLNDLVGSPILEAEEVSNIPEPTDVDVGNESHTWTFYRFATNKGSVVIRWLGKSNGCYSEKVSFVEE